MAIPTSFRLSEKALGLLARLAERDGIEKSDVLEILIRERARELNMEDASPAEDKAKS